MGIENERAFGRRHVSLRRRQSCFGL
jgi:hypothetical protein